LWRRRWQRRRFVEQWRRISSAGALCRPKLTPVTVAADNSAPEKQRDRADNGEHKPFVADQAIEFYKRPGDGKHDHGAQAQTPEHFDCCRPFTPPLLPLLPCGFSQLLPLGGSNPVAQHGAIEPAKKILAATMARNTGMKIRRVPLPTTAISRTPK